MKTFLIALGLAGCLAGLLSPGERDAQPEATQGVHMTFHGNGRRKAELTLERGQRHGPAREWYADGGLAAEGRYEHGQRTGTWHFFLPDGSPDPARTR